MQEEILEAVTRLVSSVGIPAAVNLADVLPRNNYVPKWRKRNLTDIKGMVWHQAMSKGTIEGVAKYHTSDKSHLRNGGVESIAYTFAIRKNGQVVLCNDLTAKTWSQGYRKRAGDENAEFISVMFEGFFTGDGITNPNAGEPTLQQIFSGLVLWKMVRKQMDLKHDALYGHSSFGKPACPGRTLDAVIDAFIVADVRKIV